MQAAKIFKVPTAAICIYDRQRLWIKSLHSLKQKVTEVPRESSFCSYMLLSPKQEVMVVEDTHEDGRSVLTPSRGIYGPKCN